MRRNYGLPYMGSKNKIARWVLEQLPEAENFYDLFCGGCAITDCAMEYDKYNNYVINDIKGELPSGFIDALNGKFKNEDRWISREDFNRLKGTGDLYVDLCFSFGNNWEKGYMYSTKIEPLKKAAHYAIFYGDYSLCDAIGLDVRYIGDIESRRERYLAFKRIVKESIGHFQLQRLESLERLQRLQSLESPYRLEAYNLSYDEIEIMPNSVIYCDIPYRDTEKYQDSFDYDKFYSWALSQTEPVYISEYWMPADFVCIAEKERISPLSATNNSLKKIEKIFVPKHQFEK